MNIAIETRDGRKAAVVTGDELLITDEQSALDLLATASYQFECNRIVISKANVCEEFFDLRTRLAGGILQKFVNYQTKLAIYGDFSGYESKALRDFIYESNNGKDIFFAADREDALSRVTAAE